MPSTSNTSNYYSIGIDVGGTNTDAVIIQSYSREVLNSVKVPTTKDFFTGVLQAIKKVVISQDKVTELHISSVMIGTTAFSNAVIQGSPELSPVTVIRLCGTASLAYPPFSGFPENLAKALKSESFLVSGGYEFDKREIKSLNEGEIKDLAIKLCNNAKENKSSLNLVICGIFSPLCPDQEEKAAEIFRKVFEEANFQDFSITLTNRIASMGLLEREGAAVLNASLRPMAKKYITNLKQAIQGLNLKNCANNIYLTSNDGTLITCDDAVEYPIFTFNSGPTNSLRGASALCKIKDAMVIDIGGTTTDIAVLTKGFPRPASSYVEVAGVRTNFRMPDTQSIGLGGGSLVEFGSKKCSVGPVSVGYKLLKEAKCFGGKILTASDIAVAAGIAKIEGADPSKAGVSEEQIKQAQAEMLRKIEVLVDRMKTSSEPVPLILVGGGSILIPEDAKIQGTSELIKPQHSGVANAIGAAIAQISIITDTVVDLQGKKRSEEIKKIKEAAKSQVVEKGAVLETVEVIVDEVHLSYAPGEIVRVTYKAAGDLDLSKIAETVANTHESSQINNIHIKNEEIEPFVKEFHSVDNDDTICDLKSAIIKYNEKTKRKEWILSEEDIEYISIGAGILGTGGGGSPYLGKLIMKKLLKEGKLVRVISPDSVEEGEYSLPYALYGAPFVMLERTFSGNEVRNPITKILTQQKEMDKNIGSITPVEIGGINSMFPLYAGALMDLPVLDVDFMGRAFPEYPMITPIIYGRDCTPVCMANEKGTAVVISEVENPQVAENLLRNTCMEFGCSAGLCLPPISKKDIDEISIKYSISRAWKLGRSIIEANKNKEHIDKVIQRVENGKLIFVGKVIDIHRITKGAYNFGDITVQGLDAYKGKEMNIKFQNENLIAYVHEENNGDAKECIATVPDLICMLDSESYHPILTEDYKYGLRVSCFYLPGHPLLKTPLALSKIGPVGFGYPDVAVVSFPNEYVEPRCVIDGPSTHNI